MITRKSIVDDVLLRLRRHSDDSSIEAPEVAQWVDVQRSELLAEYIEKNAEVPNSIKKVVTCLALDKKFIECDRCFEYSIKLPFPIMTLRRDAGVQHIYGQGRREIAYLTSRGQEAKTRFEPKEYAFRQGDKIIIRGDHMHDAKFTLELVPASHDQWTENEQYPFPESLLDELLMSVTRIGLEKLSIPEDIVNDGQD